MAVMGFLREHNTQKSSVEQTLIVPKNFTHSYVVGQTGCGKTSSFINPNLEDRIKNGHGIFLMDFKGAESKTVKFFSDKHQRLSQVLEIGVPWGVHINWLCSH